MMFSHHMKLARYSLNHVNYPNPSTIGLISTRSLRLEKLSNKRITRIQSDIELDSPDFKRRMINRNPRNLELLSVEKKPEGYWLEKAPFLSYYKLVYKQTGKHQYAYLQHWSGKKLIEASTNEPKLAKYFNNPGTTQATSVIAQVVTRRCLQGGYLCAEKGVCDDVEKLGEKSRIFYETVESNGFTLEELPEIQPRNVSDP